MNPNPLRKPSTKGNNQAALRARRKAQIQTAPTNKDNKEKDK